MTRIDYNFNINHKVLVELQEILNQGKYPTSFLAEFRKITEDSSYRPNTDFHWEVSRLISIYYRPEMLKIDPNFSRLHTSIMKKWKESEEDSYQIALFSRLVARC